MKMWPHPVAHPHKLITGMFSPPTPFSPRVYFCLLAISYIAGYWLFLFVLFLTSTFSWSLKTQKRTWLMSSQLDLMPISSSRAYSQSSPCHHSGKQPALFTATFVKPPFVIKSSRKRPRPLLGLPSWTFPLFLSSCKQPLNSFLH